MDWHYLSPLLLNCFHYIIITLLEYHGNWTIKSKKISLYNYYIARITRQLNFLNPTKWTSYCIFVEQTSNANHFHCHACSQNIHACYTNKLILSPHHPTLPMSTKLEAVNSPIADPHSNFPFSIRKTISSLFINNDRVTGLKF